MKDLQDFINFKLCIFSQLENSNKVYVISFINMTNLAKVHCV